LKTGKSITELLILLQKGDQVAFYFIYEGYSKRLYGFVLRFLKQKEDAEEIVQEVFIKIWESKNKIDIFSSFESYIFTIAYNATISLLRKRITENKYLEHLKSIQFEHTPEIIEEIHYRQLNEKVQLLLDKLTPRQKEIFLLSREEGLSHNEISEKLNISVLTVKKHISNTLSFLKSSLGNNLIFYMLYIWLFVC
jgi:RNA polymerase sigma-70 factor (ECF subfamily)